MLAYSTAASDSLRLNSSVLRVSANRPFDAYHRGESGSASMPSSRSTAGTEATASMYRHTVGSSIR